MKKTRKRVRLDYVDINYRGVCFVTRQLVIEISVLLEYLMIMTSNEINIFSVVAVA